MDLNISPISSIQEQRSQKEVFQKKEPSDSKIREFVLARITHAQTGLLPAVITPKIVIPTIRKTKTEVPTKQKFKLRKIPLVKRAPIGLISVDPEGIMNAMMQFVISIPELAQNFYFAPRSFSLFQEFIDQYTLDQQEKRLVSRVNGLALFRFLSSRLSKVAIHEIFLFFAQSLHIRSGCYCKLDEAVLKEKGGEGFFLVQTSLEKQILIERCYYELDAFIELRPDEQNVNFITFVKVDGIWYSCDDERVTKLRSNSLQEPLERSLLLHYKKIFN